MKIDKQNGTVAFNDQEHIYWNVNDNKRYVSVTTLIHRYTQEFDKEFWSSYKALEKLLPKKSWEIEKKSLLNTKKFNKELLSLYDIDENDFNAVQQDILDAWDEENRKSCERGTKIHSEIENSFYDHPTDISLKKLQLIFHIIPGNQFQELLLPVESDWLVSFPEGYLLQGSTLRHFHP